MKNMKKRLLKKVIKIAEKTAGVTGDGWPPCIGYIYQPKRPTKIDKISKHDLG